MESESKSGVNMRSDSPTPLTKETAEASEVPREKEQDVDEMA